jgi:LPXTG-motif cell wall-anchored protein
MSRGDVALRLIAFPLFLWMCVAPFATAQAAGSDPAQRVAYASPDAAVILAAPDDPYYLLAREVALRDAIPMVHTIDEAMELDPSFLLWVVSPEKLSDQALLDLSLALRDRRSAISVGMISGETLEDARELWLRAAEFRRKRRTGEGYSVAVNASNPSGNIEAQISVVRDGLVHAEPLAKPAMLRHLQQADYLTFTGHGGKSYLGLDETTTLRPPDIPSLAPVVVATGSCNTFRPWAEDSIALALTRQGAAAYAGFAYSPNEGYLIGEFDGLPFRYTWPGFPIGHVVQIQNQGALQGFAQLPYYFLLGDPRLALVEEQPYELVEDSAFGNVRTLVYADAPAGYLPVQIPGGARYSFVEIPGISTAWERGPFYNARLQMVDIQNDKYLLFAHKGGDFTLRLRTRPPWYWVASDLLTDALDDTLLYVPQTGGDILSLVAAGIVLATVGWLLLRKRARVRSLIPAALAGLGFAAMHGLYARIRLDSLTITSKLVEFSPLALVGTFLLVGCGAFLFLNARSWRGKAVAIGVATFAALAPALFSLATLALMNNFFLRPELGVGLWNYALGLQPLIATLFLSLVLALVFMGLSYRHRTTEASLEAII